MGKHHIYLYDLNIIKLTLCPESIFNIKLISGNQFDIYNIRDRDAVFKLMRPIFKINFSK